AMVIRRYGEGAGGGGGATFCLGFREPWCAAAETPLACGGDPGDPCAVANARSDADAACDCTTAPTHRQYVACVARVAGDEVEGGQLPAACRPNVERCASRSTCGRADHVTCCRTSATGSTTCAIKRSASCRAPRGGRGRGGGAGRRDRPDELSAGGRCAGLARVRGRAERAGDRLCGGSRDPARPDRAAARLARLRRPHGAPRRAARRDDRRRAARLLRARRTRLPRLPHRRPSPDRRGRARRASGPRRHPLPGARCRRPLALPGVLLPPGAGDQAPADDGQGQPALMAVETTDVVVIGTGFGGAIPGYYLAAGGAGVVMLERGPRLATEDFTHNLQLGTFTRIVDDIRGDGVDVIAGNCVGG